MDRRAFLKGMMVTSAGLLVPGAAVIDMGARSVSPGGLPPRRIWIFGSNDLQVGDFIQITGTGAKSDGRYEVTKVFGSDLHVARK